MEGHGQEGRAVREVPRLPRQGFLLWPRAADLRKQRRAWHGGATPPRRALRRPRAVGREGGPWTMVRRNQFTEVTGPGGIYGNSNPASDPIWTIGWDHRSLILMVLDGGKWHSFRLPKVVAQLRRRARLEYRVAAHPRDRREGLADDDARGVLAIPGNLLGEEHGRPCAARELPQGHRRLLPLERPARVRLRRHGEERVHQQAQGQGRNRRAAVAVEPVVRRAGSAG